MKKVIYFFIFVLLLPVFSFAQSKFDQDRLAILSLGGYYKVSFAYAETFAADTAYRFYPQYHTSGYEWAVIQEDSPRKIVIQHILLTGDSSVIKHWREDWVYEENTLLTFDKDNTWKKVKLPAGDEKVLWVQKVYQVDDSPRYESTGTWVHVDGRHQWQSECDSPLPRKEYTKRGDYNVLRRGNRIYLTANGWMFEQDNQKIIRSATGDRLLVREKGYEEFSTTDKAKFSYAQKWWTVQQPYWTVVRKVWDDLYAENQAIKLKGKVDGKPLYEKLFELADLSVTEKWDAAKSRSAAQKLIKKYLDTVI